MIRIRSLFSKYFFELCTFKGRRFYKISRYQGGNFKRTQTITIPPSELEDFKNFLKLVLIELQSSPVQTTQKEFDVDYEFPKEDEEVKDDEEIEDV